MILPDGHRELPWQLKLGPPLPPTPVSLILTKYQSLNNVFFKKNIFFAWYMFFGVSSPGSPPATRMGGTEKESPWKKCLRNNSPGGGGGGSWLCENVLFTKNILIKYGMGKYS